MASLGWASCLIGRGASWQLPNDPYRSLIESRKWYMISEIDGKDQRAFVPIAALLIVLVALFGLAARSISEH